MLKQASGYEQQLKLESVWARDLPKYKAFVFNADGFIELYNDSQKYCEMASINSDNNIVGFFRYIIKDNTAENLEVICFKGNAQNMEIFAKDFKQFWQNVFEREKLKSVSFSVLKDTESADKWLHYAKIYNSPITERDGWLFCTINSKEYFNLDQQEIAFSLGG